jgi:pimeloyl-ACP methyl ester carboxylesterase
MSRNYQRDGLIFDILEFGEKNKEVVILLHGFPANAHSWQPTAELLAKQGYRVLAPEQRGYSKRARPKHRRDYKLSELVKDVAALLDGNDIKSAHIVGHDWGGVVAWAFAAQYPERTLSLAAVSTPHPRALISSTLKSKQLFLSWYMLFFQLPYLPEFIVKKTLKRSLVNSGLSDVFAASYARNMQDTSLLKGALNWYRALPFTLREARKIGKAFGKTLFIYGEKDAFLSKAAAVETKNWVKGDYRFVQQTQATHWIPEESPEWLASKITEFIK